MVSIRVLFGVYIQCTISYHLSYSVVAGRQRISDGNIFLGSVGHVCEYAQSFYTVCFFSLESRHEHRKATTGTDVPVDRGEVVDYDNIGIGKGRIPYRVIDCY